MDPFATIVNALLRADARFVVMDVCSRIVIYDVWSRRRTFIIDGVEIPVASLADIVQSKADAGREKDRLFLATHEDALQQLFGDGADGSE